MTTLLEPNAAVADAGTRASPFAPLEAESSALDALEQRLRIFADVARWATLTVGILGGLITGPIDFTFLTVAVAFFGYAVLAGRRPIPLDLPNERAGVRIGLELVLVVLGVTATGATHSPFVLTPMTAMVLAGYIWGDRLIRGSAVVASIATLFAITMGAVSGEAGTAANLGLIFLLCGLLGTFGRSSLVEVEVQRAAALDQITQMGTANELLVALHTLAQTLPASLDLGEVITSTRNRLRSLLDFSALTILVRDDTGEGWRVELAEGLRLPATLPLAELPRTLQFAATTGSPIVVADLLAPGEEGCAPFARSGLYAPLRTRGSVVGLIAIEHLDADAYTSRDADLIANLSGLVALSVDNAKWFGRLRLFGAEAERARIARDLHDRIGQSLAYVAFELERLRDSGEHPAELDSLHDFVRSIVTELRETLYQLRAGVTEDQDLSAVASEFLSRFEERTGVQVHWFQRVHHRLPLPLEQEVWRILQEAVTNVERHARATNLHVAWEVIGPHARLEVRDDGEGFDPAAVSGDHYGLIGARERADAIRARLTVTSAPKKGTKLLLHVEGHR
jgi:signal transduction histidine kinase